MSTGLCFFGDNDQFLRIILIGNLHKDTLNPQQVLHKNTLFHISILFHRLRFVWGQSGTLWGQSGDGRGMLWDALGMIWDRFNNPNQTYLMNFGSGDALGRSGDDV